MINHLYFKYTLGVVGGLFVYNKTISEFVAHSNKSIHNDVSKRLIIGSVGAGIGILSGWAFYSYPLIPFAIIPSYIYTSYHFEYLRNRFR